MEDKCLAYYLIQASTQLTSNDAVITPDVDASYY